MKQTNQTFLHQSFTKHPQNGVEAMRGDTMTRESEHDAMILFALASLALAKGCHHEYELLSDRAIHVMRLCCKNPMRDSSCESGVVAGVDELSEQTDL